MSIFSSVGAGLGSAVTALEQLGVSAANIPSALKAMFASQNPNESEELALCSQIIAAYGNPAEVQLLAQKLVTEQGIPPAAANMALALPGSPSTAIPAMVETMETIIKNNG